MTTTPPPADDTSTWVAGCLLFLVGSVVINFGQTVIRLSHITTTPHDAEGWKRYKATLLWCGGLALFASGDLANLAGLNLAAQSLLEALGSVQFISNMVFSVTLLGERLKRRHVVSTALIVLGNVLIVAWGDHKSQKMTLTLVTRLVSSHVFLVYLAVVYSLALAIGLTEYFSRSTATAARRAGWGAALYAVSSAMVGANSVMVIKALSGLVETYITSPEADRKPPTVRLVLTLALTVVIAMAHIVFWLTRLNSALRRYEALFIIPLLQVCWICFTVTSGGIFFGEFTSLSPRQILGFTGGVGVVILGVLVLIPAGPHTPSVLGGGRVGPRGRRQHEVADRAFERGFGQAKVLLEAGELDDEEYDTMARMLVRSWKAQRQEIIRQLAVEEEEGLRGE
eukprot:CAMPEP_0173401698 /NCGR_PEP_ID=MMETSP1356-20130122/51677_1 /TAXON_ID=77927 ORGANISM="Hemiselmis virescens, Strain PCC157" /NCGR_SAMPLE_ID=MMETSP1356 /ASSEMBLY_ACC=CAM_ASM_000847 /LENGTH=396 /DNA_ID=CAMNT_0014361897 /DNA_START=42 /DNA_END=1229 /DNA_ORIENTATION=+